MAEYIDRKALLNSICKKYCNCDYDGECPNCRLTEPIVAAPAASVPQWISVKDRLPCSGQPALVANSALRLVSIAWHDAGSGCWESPVWWFCENSPEITHWMPLPETPSAADGKPCCFCDLIDPLLNCYQRKDEEPDENNV